MTTFPIQTHDQRAVLGVAFTFAILAAIAVSLRLLAHAIAHKQWTASDYLIIIACIFAVALQSVSITGVIQAGIGYGHVADIAMTYGPEPITKLLQLIIPLQFLWVLSLSCTKISILFLYLRIFPVRWLAWSSWVTISVIVAWAIATILAGCLICRPFAFNWDQTIPGGKCGDQVTSFTITGVVNLLTDVTVLVLPMPSLYKLQMATYKKVTLIAVFGLGAVTCVISALRVSILSTMDFADITYTIPRANIFSGMEPCLAVVLASVPMMRPLLGRASKSPNGSGLRSPAKSGSKSTGQKGTNGVGVGGGGDGFGFEQLDDNASQVWLRPVGPKHCAGISVDQAPVDEGEGDLSGGSQVSLDRTQGRGGMTVKQEWGVLAGAR
ncbi:putative integral membrane protein [Aspergillus lucknowensis]|uniref:Rhodopsin domain-containing protein n=1 Tax=Aspergillus lucknowensis TaxID=176173 RepID=A0ABR4LFY5_9EURO